MEIITCNPRFAETFKVAIPSSVVQLFERKTIRIDNLIGLFYNCWYIDIKYPVFKIYKPNFLIIF